LGTGSGRGLLLPTLVVFFASAAGVIASTLYFFQHDLEPLGGHVAVLGC